MKYFDNNLNIAAFGEVMFRLSSDKHERIEQVNRFNCSFAGSEANGLLVKLLEEGSRPVTLLDGDIVRTHLSSELGFSKKHRSINVQRIGYVASEITKNGGIAICAPIAPYEKDRQFNRKVISKVGGYVEIYVNTPLNKCEERDVKGLYSLARKGVIEEFTGVSDPYEKPSNPEIIIDSSNIAPEILVNMIYSKISDIGYI